MRGREEERERSSEYTSQREKMKMLQQKGNRVELYKHKTAVSSEWLNGRRRLGVSSNIPCAPSVPCNTMTRLPI
jgi:hypothetical protein